MTRIGIAALAAAAALAVATPSLAQEAFAVSGSDIGSGKDDYTGKVTVAKSGDTWKVQWDIKGEKASSSTAAASR